jgi:cytochrome oxidase Cu insertion factor (SCO1/SenC/PrrC family)
MTRFISIALLTAALFYSSAFAASKAMRSPLAGQIAPDFKLADQNGRAVTLSAARGQKVVIVFYRGYW